METIKLKLTGTSPLLMHNPRLVDALDPATKALAQAVANERAKKTDAARIALRKCEFEGGLYWDKNLGPYVEGNAVLKAIIEAARLERKGTHVERGVAPLEDRYPLQYKGPRDPKKLWEAGFYDVRSIGVNDRRVMRTRPKFTDWTLEVELAYVPEQVNGEDLLRFAEQAGLLLGLMDGRTIRMGRFTVRKLS